MKYKNNFEETVYCYTEMVVFNHKLVFWWGVWLAFILRFWKAVFSQLAGLVFSLIGQG